MEVFFRKFVEIGLAHDYFENSLSPYFGIIPTESSQKRMKSFDVLAKSSKNSYSLYCGCKTMDSSMESELIGLDDLYFYVLNTDSAFSNYTNSRMLDTNQEILYLVNRQNGTTLQKGDFVTEEDILPLKPLKIQLEIDPGNVGLRQLKKDGELLIEEEYSETSNSLFHVNLIPFGEGSYEFLIDDELQSAFFATSKSVPKNCIAIIQLRIEDVLTLFAENKLAEYSIDFEARSCYWQYNIAFSAQYKIEVKGLNIELSNHPYEGPVEEELPNGTKVKVFTSDQEYKLVNFQERPAELSVKYNNIHADRDSELRIKLPLPNALGVQSGHDLNGKEVHFAPTLIYV
ncbi:MAG: hypothetical protein ACI837_003014 [Crocinitomicaceae bacterium]|jgi:hypothetical protein